MNCETNEIENYVIEESMKISEGIVDELIGTIVPDVDIGTILQAKSWGLKDIDFKGNRTGELIASLRNSSLAISTYFVRGIKIGLVTASINIISQGWRTAGPVHGLTRVRVNLNDRLGNPIISDELFPGWEVYCNNGSAIFTCKFPPDLYKEIHGGAITFPGRTWNRC